MPERNSIAPYVPSEYRNWVAADDPAIDLPVRDRRTVHADNKPAPVQLLIVTLCGWALVGVVATIFLARVVGSVEWAALTVVLSVIVLVFLSLIIFNGDFLGWRQIAADTRIDRARLFYEDAERERRHETARKAIESHERVQMARVDTQGALGRLDAVESVVGRLEARADAPRLGIGGDDAPAYVAPVQANSGAAFDDRTLSETEREAIEWVRENLYTADGRVNREHVLDSGRLHNITRLWNDTGASGHPGHKQALEYHGIIQNIPGGQRLCTETYPTADHLPHE